MVDLSAEILSQHSSKTLDLNIEVLSTHSSKTLEGGCNTPGGRITPDRSSRNMGSAPDLRDASSTKGGAGSAGSGSRTTLDKERIETWVAETQKQIERLSINGLGSSDVEEVDEEDIEENEQQGDQDEDEEGLDFTHAPVLGTDSNREPAPPMVEMR